MALKSRLRERLGYEPPYLHEIAGHCEWREAIPQLISCPHAVMASRIIVGTTVGLSLGVPARRPRGQ